MSFPLGLWDLSLWLAITAIILFIASELLPSDYGRMNIYINRKRLRNVALAVSILFLATVVIRVIDMILFG